MAYLVRCEKRRLRQLHEHRADWLRKMLPLHDTNSRRNSVRRSKRWSEFALYACGSPLPQRSQKET